MEIEGFGFVVYGGFTVQGLVLQTFVMQTPSFSHAPEGGENMVAKRYKVQLSIQGQGWGQCRGRLQ